MAETVAAELRGTPAQIEAARKIREQASADYNLNIYSPDLPESDRKALVSLHRWVLAAVIDARWWLNTPELRYSRQVPGAFKSVLVTAMNTNEKLRTSEPFRQLRRDVYRLIK